MSKAIAINGSPQKDRGSTAMVLGAFLEGLRENHSEVELLHASRLKIRPCTCNGMQCWYDTPGKCCIHDDMEDVYPKLKEAEMLILATPVYIPLPGDMQNFINRLCPLLYPKLEFREGRTRARFREDVRIEKIVLVSSGGWWEKENMDTVVRIVEELAENSGAAFAGALLRPHAFLMKKDGVVTEAGQEILDAAKTAGQELMREGKIRQKTLDEISHPLISEEELRGMYNQWL